MMVFEPVLIRVTGLGELIGGALIGGTVDSTGAVTVAGTALGETAQTVAVLVKSIQNILIGFIAFAVAVFFATKVENNGENSRKIGVSEIWYRLPKFILGFFAASLIASFIAVPAFGKRAFHPSTAYWISIKTGHLFWHLQVSDWKQIFVRSKNSSRAENH